MKYQDIVPFYQKLNANCPDSEKNGSGPGSCGGKTSNEFKNPPEFNLEKKIEESNSWVSSKINTPGTVDKRRNIMNWAQNYTMLRKQSIGKISDPKYAKMLDDVESTIMEGPKWNGPTFRGIANISKANIDALKSKKTIVWKEPTSTSAFEEVSALYARGENGTEDNSVLFRIKNSKSGVYIGTVDPIYQMVGEVFVPRNTKYKVLNSGITTIKTTYSGEVKTTYIDLEELTSDVKQNSTPMKLSMKHPGNWSTAASLDTKIKKELKSSIQDVLDVLKSVGYFKEDPKEVALNEAYKKIAQELFNTHIKLNANCKEEEKIGSGPGSCSGGLKDSINSSKVDLHPKLLPGDFDSMLKASKAIRNDKSEPDKVLRRMMAEEVERKFVRETKEAFQAIKDVNDEFIKNSGNDTWTELSSESQSAIRGYTASDYGVINSALAEGIERPEVALIKAAMKPLERETILYRGVSFDLPKEVTKFGTIWENKPFASCSTGSFIAEEAALGKLTHDGVAKIPTVLEILTSKNTKGFAVGKNSFHAVADAGSEVILDTGTKFQTLSVDKSGRIRKITVRVIDD